MFLEAVLIQLLMTAAKPGQKTLEALDEYRYNDALDMFSPGKDTRSMKLDDIKTLVEWKL